MPDHIHALIWLNDSTHSVSDVIGQFKAATTKQINARWGHHGESIWQRGFHDTIIRDDRALNNIRGYIDVNPARWDG